MVVRAPRARRLVPALLLILAVVVLGAGHALAEPPDFSAVDNAARDAVQSGEVTLTRLGGLTNQNWKVEHGGEAFVLRIAGAGTEAYIDREVEAVKGWIKASPPAPGFDEVLLPGEPEQRAFAQRSAEGIPLDERSLADIVAAGVGLGLDRGLLAPLAGLEG